MVDRLRVAAQLVTAAAEPHPWLQSLSQRLNWPVVANPTKGTLLAVIRELQGSAAVVEVSRPPLLRKSISIVQLIRRCGATTPVITWAPTSLQDFEVEIRCSGASLLVFEYEPAERLIAALASVRSADRIIGLRNVDPHDIKSLSSRPP